MISAEHVSEVGRVMYLLNEAAERTNASIDRYRALVEEEGRQQARIEEQERDLIVTGDTLNAAEARQAELTLEREARSQVVDDELALQRSLLATLDGAIADFETELDALAGEQRRLEELIDSGGGVGGAAPGLLVRPVPGRITSPFGPRVHPILGYTKMHTGLDMSAPLGQPIRSAAGGKVILAGSNGGYGLTIVIDHGGGMTTVYAHQSRLLVSAGDTVDAGDTIGESGSTGLSTGPHLHFEVRIGGQPADPEPYL